MAPSWRRRATRVLSRARGGRPSRGPLRDDRAASLPPARAAARDAPATAARARGVIEAFVTDMDDCLREAGVGDLSVPRKVKRAAAGPLRARRGLPGGARAPRSGRAGGAIDRARELGAADGDGAVALARYTRRAKIHLERQTTADLLAGRLSFPAVQDLRGGALVSEPLDWAHGLAEIGENGLERERPPARPNGPRSRARSTSSR